MDPTHGSSLNVCDEFNSHKNLPILGFGGSRDADLLPEAAVGLLESLAAFPATCSVRRLHAALGLILK